MDKLSGPVTVDVTKRGSRGGRRVRRLATGSRSQGGQRRLRGRGILNTSPLCPILMLPPARHSQLCASRLARADRILVDCRVTGLAVPRLRHAARKGRCRCAQGRASWAATANLCMRRNSATTVADQIFQRLFPRLSPSTSPPPSSHTERFVKRTKVHRMLFPPAAPGCRCTRPAPAIRYRCGYGLRRLAWRRRQTGWDSS